MEAVLMPETLLRRVIALASVDDDEGIDVISGEVMDDTDDQDQMALEHALAYLEPTLRAGRFAEADEYLTALDVGAASPLVLIGILSLTFWGKEKMLARPAFLVRAEERVRATLGPARAESLLAARR